MEGQGSERRLRSSAGWDVPTRPQLFFRGPGMEKGAGGALEHMEVSGCIAS